MAFFSPLQRRSRLVLLLVWCASSVVRVLVSQRGRAASLASLLVALCFRCIVVFAWRFAVLCSVVLGMFCFWFGAPLLLLGCLVSQRGRAASLATLLVALCFRCIVVFAWRFAVLCSVVLGLFCFWFGAPLLLLGCWCRSVVEMPASPLFLWRCAFVALWLLLGVLQSFVASFSACFASGLVRLFCC